MVLKRSTSIIVQNMMQIKRVLHIFCMTKRKVQRISSPGWQDSFSAGLRPLSGGRKKSLPTG